ncbi:MAG: hypothetical protein ACOC5T_06825 [Elusimicrobiota bacterium]
MNRVIKCLCGKKYKIEGFFFGRVCTRCGIYIPGDGEMKIQKNNKIKKEEMKKKAINSFEKKNKKV